MGTPDDIKTLFAKIDNLVTGQSTTNVELTGIRGDMKVFATELKHLSDTKVDRMDLKDDGFWNGMTASQKALLITLVATNLAQLATNIFG